MGVCGIEAEKGEEKEREGGWGAGLGGGDIKIILEVFEYSSFDEGFSVQTWKRVTSSRESSLYHTYLVFCECLGG